MAIIKTNQTPLLLEMNLSKKAAVEESIRHRWVNKHLEKKLSTKINVYNMVAYIIHLSFAYLIRAL